MSIRDRLGRRAERLRDRRDNLIASGVDPYDLTPVHDLADALPEFQAERGPVVYNTALVVQLQYLRALVKAWMAVVAACAGAGFACVLGINAYLSVSDGVPWPVLTLGTSGLGWACLTVIAIIRVWRLRREARTCMTKITDPEDTPDDQ